MFFLLFAYLFSSISLLMFLLIEELDPEDFQVYIRRPLIVFMIPLMLLWLALSKGYDALERMFSKPEDWDQVGLTFEGLVETVEDVWNGK